MLNKLNQNEHGARFRKHHVPFFVPVPNTTFRVNVCAPSRKVFCDDGCSLLQIIEVMVVNVSKKGLVDALVIADFNAN